MFFAAKPRFVGAGQRLRWSGQDLSLNIAGMCLNIPSGSEDQNGCGNNGDVLNAFHKMCFVDDVNIRHVYILHKFFTNYFKRKRTCFRKSLCINYM